MLGFGALGQFALGQPTEPGRQFVTDTNKVQLPINAVLAGQQDYEVGDTEIEARDPNIRTRTSVSHGGGGRLSSNESTFRVRKDNKGYD